MTENITIGIIQFPGSNTERETFKAVRRAGMEPLEVLWNEPAEKLHTCQGYVIVGGFSYEDRSRAGVIASLDPIMNIIQQEAEAGKPVLGICNGAQILVEKGLIPGRKYYKPGLGLTDNKRIKDGHVMGTGYYNTWANLQLSVPPERTAFTRHLKIGDWITIPLAHAEGRFVTSDEILNTLIDNDQTVFRYCDDEGNVSNEFPVNPNGSRYNLAAVCNPAGNVISIMPHPERTPLGDAIFTSMRDYILSGERSQQQYLDFEKVSAEIKPYSPDPEALEMTVELIITDNTAASVHNALQHLGITALVTRHTHWEVKTKSAPTPELIAKINASGELYNSNKEILVTMPKNQDSVQLLVHNHEDVLGQQKLEMLTKRFELDELTEIKHGQLWTISTTDGDLDQVVQQVLDTHILFNPLAHNCYYYQSNE